MQYGDAPPRCSDLCDRAKLRLPLQVAVWNHATQQLAGHFVAHFSIDALENLCVESPGCS